MMKETKKVFILTEGGRGIGFGHITRCISLGQALEEKGVKPELIVNGDDSVRGLLREGNGKIFHWAKDPQRLFHSLKIKSDDIVIIDSYLADFSVYKKISEMVGLPVFLDDTKRLNYPRGIIVNSAVYAETLNYQSSVDNAHLLGTKFAPLRKEFWRDPQNRIRKELRSIFISLGGADTRNLTAKVLKYLNQEFPELIKNVAIGRGIKNIDKIKKARDKSNNLIFSPDALTMKGIMLDSDIAISAGGQTIYELARIGLPTLALAIANNQLNNLNGWKKAGFIQYLGWWNDERLFKNIKTSIERLRNQNAREKSSRIGKFFVDGMGSRRIAAYLLNKKL